MGQNKRDRTRLQKAAQMKMMQSDSIANHITEVGTAELEDVGAIVKVCPLLFAPLKVMV
jgi:hypothetical protein